MSASDAPGKGSVSTTCKELPKLSPQTADNAVKKWAGDTNTFPRRPPTAHKRRKRRPTSLSVGKRIETAARRHVAPVRTAGASRETPGVGEDADKGEPRPCGRDASLGTRRGGSSGRGHGAAAAPAVEGWGLPRRIQREAVRGPAHPSVPSSAVDSSRTRETVHVRLRGRVGTDRVCPYVRGILRPSESTTARRSW